MEGLLIYLVGVFLGLAILYVVIHSAVKSALFAHYKVIRWYEATGEWLPRTGSWKVAPSVVGSHPDPPIRRSGSLK